MLRTDVHYGLEKQCCKSSRKSLDRSTKILEATTVLNVALYGDGQ